MIYFEEGSKKLIPSFKKIWKICFGDTDSYIDFFFANRFDTCKSVAMRDGEKVIGAMYLMPVSVYEYGVLKHGFYGYAIGILPQYRGRGIYADLDKLIYEYIKRHNLFYILCPANQKLSKYYKSLGFTENAFVCEKTVLNTRTEKEYSITALTPEAYETMRNSSFADMIYWDKTALSYVLKENEFMGGYNLLCKDKGIYVIAIKTGDTLKIIESNVSEGEMQNITDYLCKRYKANSAVWTVPQNRTDPSVLYGLSRNLKKDNYYFNLILG